MTNSRDSQFEQYLWVLRATGSMAAVVRRFPNLSPDEREALEAALHLIQSRVDPVPMRPNTPRLLARLQATEEKAPQTFARLLARLAPL